MGAFDVAAAPVGCRANEFGVCIDDDRPLGSSLSAGHPPQTPPSGHAAAQETVIGDLRLLPINNLQVGTMFMNMARIPTHLLDLIRPLGPLPANAGNLEKQYQGTIAEREVRLSQESARATTRGMFAAEALIDNAKIPSPMRKAVALLEAAMAKQAVGIRGLTDLQRLSHLAQADQLEGPEHLHQMVVAEINLQGIKAISEALQKADALAKQGDIKGAKAVLQPLTSLLSHGATGAQGAEMLANVKALAQNAGRNASLPAEFLEAVQQLHVSAASLALALPKAGAGVMQDLPMQLTQEELEHVAAVQKEQSARGNQEFKVEDAEQLVTLLGIRATTDQTQQLLDQHVNNSIAVVADNGWQKTAGNATALDAKTERQVAGSAVESPSQSNVQKLPALDQEMLTKVSGSLKPPVAAIGLMGLLMGAAMLFGPTRALLTALGLAGQDPTAQPTSG